MSNIDYIKEYLSEVRQITKNISIDNIDEAIELLYKAWQNGNHIFACGNGGSASTATHFTCDLTKMTIVPNKRRFWVECLNDNIPLILALVNDDGFDNLFYEQIKAKFQEGDILICISVHGGVGKDKAELWSQNLVKATNYAIELGGKTIALSGFDGGVLKDIADVSIVIPANSTPHVESFHLVLEHLICSRLQKKIEES